MINLETLNPPQKQAVTTTEGPVLVLAGAGSGKTKALTYRIAYLIDAGLAGPTNILAMTFTNKAAGEMRERIIKLLSESGMTEDIRSIPWMGTFHSICVKILKIHGEQVGLSRNFTIYDSADQLSATKEAMSRLNISIKEFNPRSIHSYISSAKNELVAAEDYHMYAQGFFQQTVADVYPEYQKVLRENNAVDFDDLLFLVVKLLKENLAVREHFQNQFKYILVDEYQDTNQAQYMIIKYLSEAHQNICCVGDDDQSIYAFRGATIKNILNFEKDFPNCTVIKLEQNYRSTKKILEASYQVISKNRSRKDKKLWTENIDGENITLYQARDEIDEGRWIVDRIQDLSEKVSLNEIAVLYRTNAQSRSLEESFLNGNIPYKIVGGVKFYERKEIKDIMAYLRLVFNPRDNASLERIINVPRRNIGPKSLADLKESARQVNKSVVEYIESESVESKIKKFGDLVRDLKQLIKTSTLVEFINSTLEKTGYLQMLDDGTVENESRIENLKELITVASKYDDLPGEEALEEFLEDVALLEGADNLAGEEATEFVTLMTIHAAKGLEFVHVFVSGVEENLFPHSNSILDERELEEERRLAYVAITRAKDNLYLVHAKKRRYFGTTQSNPLSRFINDIDAELIDRSSSSFSFAESEWEEYSEETYMPKLTINIGDKVKHEYFGIGMVVGLDSENVTINFGAIHGTKELMLEYVKLTKL